MHMPKVTLPTIFVVIFSLLLGKTDAAVTITISQSGNSVIFNATGALEIDASTVGAPEYSVPEARGFSPYTVGFPVPVLFTSLRMGNKTPSNIDAYYLTSSFPDYGVANYHEATTSSGDIIGFRSNVLILPDGYVSGSEILSESTHANVMLSSFGFIPGSTYQAALSGNTADTVTINIVPEPSVISLGVIGCVIVSMIRRR